MFLPPSQSAVGVWKQITLLIICYISSMLVTFLKATDALYQSLIFMILMLLSIS